MAKYTNTAQGPRGGYLVSENAEGKKSYKLVMVDPGAEAELDDAPEEWFEESDGGEKGLSSMTVAELKALADDEGIDLGDASKKKDIVSAIELAREETAEQE